MSMEALDEYLGGLRQKIEDRRISTSSEGYKITYCELLPSFVLLAAGVVRSQRQVPQQVEKMVADHLGIEPAYMVAPQHSIRSRLKDYLDQSDYQIKFTRTAAVQIEDTDLPGFRPVKNVLLSATDINEQLQEQAYDAKRDVYRALSTRVIES